ncbi:hypothetical protein ACFPYI_07535 [Halomarina salina]|uniref:Uncharacterized protein n=1 Tax=Halomarina salina TaxID=1872699 RepID=A0ABD5RLC5_9EURY|nr:hypothetical protein [Halomarina salina]
MPSDSEFPFAVLLAAGVFLALLALSVGQFAALVGIGTLASAATLVALPFLVGTLVAVAIRSRLDSRRQWVQFVGASAVLAAMLEVTAVGVAARGVDQWDLVGLVVAVVLGYALLRYDLPTGTGR